LSIKICSFNLRSSSSSSDQNKDKEITKIRDNLKGIEENAISFAATVMNENEFFFSFASPVQLVAILGAH
jgi:hypothetical protein